MAINSLSGIGGFYNYRQIDIPKVDVETVKAQELEKQKNSVNTSGAANIETSVADLNSITTAQPQESVDNRPKFTNPESSSLTFLKNDDYGFLGSDADIKGLDMQKAISDMKKDKVFQDYQFFVGTSADVNKLFNSEDGKIVIK